MSVVRVKVVRMMTLLLLVVMLLVVLLLLLLVMVVVLLMLQVQVLCRLSFSRRRSLSCSHGCVVRVVVRCRAREQARRRTTFVRRPRPCRDVQRRRGFRASSGNKCRRGAHV